MAAGSAGRAAGMVWSQIYFRAIIGELSGNVDIHHSVVVRFPEKVKIGDGTVIKQRAILSGDGPGEFNLEIGPNTFIKEYCHIAALGGFIRIGGYGAIGQFCVLDGSVGGITIGKYVIMAAKNYLVGSNHVYKTLEVPYSFQGDTTRGGVFIEDNVWIGGSCMILDGVTIGRNSIIGGGSIVTRNIPPNVVAYGSPARVQRKLPWAESAEA
jgi:acetyltransferase-like isoleucine patch superfamily enzyme